MTRGRARSVIPPIDIRMCRSSVSWTLTCSWCALRGLVYVWEQVLSPPFSLHINPHCVWLIIKCFVHFLFVCVLTLYYLTCTFLLVRKSCFLPSWSRTHLKISSINPWTSYLCLASLFWTPTRTSRSLRCTSCLFLQIFVQIKILQGFVIQLYQNTS